LIFTILVLQFKPMLDKEDKAVIISKYKRHEKDTGSPEVQIALLTKRIEILGEHLKEHKKDFSSRRGLIKLIGQRNALLKYLSKKDPKTYHRLVEELNLKK
jgi:small subunit ribosomal protein S15